MDKGDFFFPFQVKLAKISKGVQAFKVNIFERQRKAAPGCGGLWVILRKEVCQGMSSLVPNALEINGFQPLCSCTDVP